jgi:hypothetical protein
MESNGVIPFLQGALDSARAAFRYVLRNSGSIFSKNDEGSPPSFGLVISNFKELCSSAFSILFAPQAPWLQSIGGIKPESDVRQAEVKRANLYLLRTMYQNGLLDALVSEFSLSDSYRRAWQLISDELGEMFRLERGNHESPEIKAPTYLHDMMYREVVASEVRRWIHMLEPERESGNKRLANYVRYLGKLELVWKGVEAATGLFREEYANQVTKSLNEFVEIDSKANDYLKYVIQSYCDSDETYLPNLKREGLSDTIGQRIARSYRNLIVAKVTELELMTSHLMEKGDGVLEDGESFRAAIVRRAEERREGTKSP